ncbi:adenylate/guanylate cyclase domain-containing protein [Flexithrix dorotheae]|uniref:adenylate/guanylate cyclase domain-containing protein n=1 Tax=Flexithrix dorotheae TaxID=70993 RepID=UPI0003724FA0|nr:adenylate/guanylate cyclase domain-containing protein [Flexithrix dorotheae]
MDKITRFANKYPKLIDIIILIIGFTFGANLFIFFKLSGINQLGIKNLIDTQNLKWYTPTLAGLFIGAGIAFLEFKVFPKIKYRIPLFLKFLLRLISFSILIIFTAFGLHTILTVIFQNEPFHHAINNSWSLINSEIFLSLYIYFVIVGGVLNFFRAIGNRFGHGIIVSYLAGKYNEPLEEARIFMFIDLNNSTTIAENLGHVKYSRFLNKCFNDLTTIIPYYEAEVYQYVGDEVVLTWRIGDVFDKRKVLDLFIEFSSKLQDNKSNYLEKFGILPNFKASINSGTVTVTEVGAQRKNLVYHGDVLNTAARILELCKTYKKNLLLTESFFQLLQRDFRYSIDFVTKIELRGKKNEVSIYGINSP